MKTRPALVQVNLLKYLMVCGGAKKIGPVRGNGDFSRPTTSLMYGGKLKESNIRSTFQRQISLTLRKNILIGSRSDDNYQGTCLPPVNCEGI